MIELSFLIFLDHLFFNISERSKQKGDKLLSFVLINKSNIILNNIIQDPNIYGSILIIENELILNRHFISNHF